MHGELRQKTFGLPMGETLISSGMPGSGVNRMVRNSMINSRMKGRAQPFSGRFNPAAGAWHRSHAFARGAALEACVSHHHFRTGSTVWDGGASEQGLFGHDDPGGCQESGAAGPS